MASVKLISQPLNQPQNGAQVTLLNQTPFEMTLSRSHDWSGTPASPGFPTTLLPNRPAIFTHLSDNDFGASGTVIYTGRNLSGLPCAWVLAWAAPAESDQAPNKVYVTCDSKFDIDAMTFSEIRNHLNNSSSTSAASDVVTNTRADANINDFIPKRATIGANFGLLP